MEDKNGLSWLTDSIKNVKIPGVDKEAEETLEEVLKSPIGRKFDKDKPRWELLPMEAISGVVDVLTFGAKVYDDDNWKHVENGEKRYYAAAMRHITKHLSGEIYDDESGYYHLDHALCDIIFWRWFVEKRLREEQKTLAENA